MTTITDLRSRLKALKTMHGDTYDASERDAWKAELELMSQLEAAFMNRLYARNRRHAALTEDVRVRP